MAHLPSGSILMWHGTIPTIPAGFVLCDGNNGTPDLRDRFIIGAGDTYTPGDSGGSLSHSHTFTGDGHFHVLAAGFGIGAGPVRSATTTVDPAFGTTDPTIIPPPYYSLAFVMKT